MVGVHSKYRRALLVFCGANAVLVLFCIYGLLTEEPLDIVSILPMKNQFYEIMTALAIYPIVASLGALVGGYLVAPAYLTLHRALYRKVIYGIQEEPPPRDFKETLRGWYPTLLAFHINSILLLSITNLSSRILTENAMGLPGSDFVVYIAGSMVLMTFTLAIGFMVFSPAWSLIDAGIVYSTKIHVQGTGRPVEGRAVGGWFHDYLRGYAGFGVALSYALILVEHFGERLASQGLSASLLDMVWMFGLPLFISLLAIPSLIILDLTRKHRIKYVRRAAARMGIRDEVQISFQKKIPASVSPDPVEGPDAGP
jgi:hypothetical protein